VQNGLITMENCRIPEENRLQAINRSATTARVLKMNSIMVGGRRRDAAMGAYENAVKYCQRAVAIRQADRLIPDGARPPGQDARQHHRFAVPLGAYVSVDLSKMTDAHASLAKAFTTAQVRGRSVGSRAARGNRHRRLVQRGAVLRLDAEAL